MSRDLVNNIFDGDNLEAEAQFNNVMIDKVGNALERKREELAKTLLEIHRQGKMKRIENVYETTVVEKDEHRKSKEYKKLSPKMRKAVDEIFKTMDAKPSDFLNSFEKVLPPCLENTR